MALQLPKFFKNLLGLGSETSSDAHRQSRSTPRADYDGIDSRRGPLPRPLRIETGPEESIFLPQGRLFLINQARELVRNSSYCRHIIRTMRNLVVGPTGGRLVMSTGDTAFDNDVSEYFNGEWARDCDSRKKMHFNRFLKLALAGAMRDGDRLTAFDDFFLDTGKLWSWEADKISNLNDNDFKARFPSSWKQIDGTVLDQYGRVKGWIVTPKQGRTSVPIAEATFIPASTGLYFGAPDEEEREDQYRSVSMFSPIVREIWCIYQMRGRELEAAKAAGSTAAVVKSSEAFKDAIAEASAGDDTSGDEELLEEGGSTPETPAKMKKRYRNLEDFATYTEYLDPDDEIIFPDTKRPNMNVSSFYESVGIQAGTAFGLYSCFSTGKVSTSWTAFRGEIVLTWLNVAPIQKHLERTLCDPIGEKSIGRALVTPGILKTNAAPANWKRKMKWLWPDPPEANPLDEANAKITKLKGGLLDFSELLGPNWREKIIKLGEQFQAMRDANLPLSYFETKAGAPVSDQSEQSQQSSQESDDAKKKKESDS